MLTVISGFRREVDGLLLSE